MSSLDCITLDAELPGGGGEIWYYPPGDHKGHVAGYSSRIVRVRVSDACTWIGVFQAGSMGCNGLMQFADDPESFVIVHRGAGYRVEVGDPKHWQELTPASDSIAHMCYFPSLDVLVLLSAGTLTVSGYNARGHMWTTPRLVLDDLDLVDHDDETLTVSGDHEALGEGTVQVVIRACNGEIISGRPFSWEDRGAHRIVRAGNSDAR